MREDFQSKIFILRAVDSQMTTLAEVKSGAINIVDLQYIIAYRDMLHDIEIANTPQPKGG
jgi:hypothetical protein